jgi:hypothetical protein
LTKRGKPQQKSLSGFTPGGSENNKQQDSILILVIWFFGYLVI